MVCQNLSQKYFFLTFSNDFQTFMSLINILTLFSKAIDTKQMRVPAKPIYCNVIISTEAFWHYRIKANVCILYFTRYKINK